jgi:hypothetical protein
LIPFREVMNPIAYLILHNPITVTDVDTCHELIDERITCVLYIEMW